MKIGILGSGSVGGSLGRLWAAAGHEVLFASRHPDTLDELVCRAGKGACAGTLDEAIAFGEIVLDALPFAASMTLPADAVAGKLLISASNYYPKRDGEIGLSESTQTESLAARLPDTRVTKAFNMMAAKEIRRRADGEGDTSLVIFHAGGSGADLVTTAELIEAARFVPLHTGELPTSRLFQTDGPLYGAKYRETEARRALEDARAAA